MTWDLETRVRQAAAAHDEEPTRDSAHALVDAYGALVGWLEARGKRPEYAERLKRQAMRHTRWAKAQGERG